MITTMASVCSSCLTEKKEGWRERREKGYLVLLMSCEIVDNSELTKLWVTVISVTGDQIVERDLRIPWWSTNPYHSLEMAGWNGQGSKWGKEGMAREADSIISKPCKWDVRSIRCMQVLWSLSLMMRCSVVLGQIISLVVFARLPKNMELILLGEIA